jgi:hypothetical protein
MHDEEGDLRAIEARLDRVATLRPGRRPGHERGP